jgi:hypothetical protein
MPRVTAGSGPHRSKKQAHRGIAAATLNGLRGDSTTEVAMDTATEREFREFMEERPR